MVAWWAAYPGFHEALKAAVFLIDVGNSEFQDHTFVHCGFGGAGDIVFLRLSWEDRENSLAGGKLGVVFTGSFGLQ